MNIIKSQVEKVNDFLEAEEFPYRLDIGYFQDLATKDGLKEAMTRLEQCKKHLGID